MKRQIIFITSSLLIGIIIDITKNHFHPNIDNFSAVITFTLLYVFIDIIMMNKILSLDVDICLDRFFSPIKKQSTNIICFLPFFISTYMYINGDITLFSIVIISIAIGDLYYFYHNSQKGE